MAENLQFRCPGCWFIHPREKGEGIFTNSFSVKCHYYLDEDRIYFIRDSTHEKKGLVFPIPPTMLDAPSKGTRDSLKMEVINSLEKMNHDLRRFLDFTEGNQ